MLDNNSRIDTVSGVKVLHVKVDILNASKKLTDVVLNLENMTQAGEVLYASAEARS